MRMQMIIVIVLIGLLPMFLGMKLIQTLYWNYDYQTRVENLTEESRELAKMLFESGYPEEQSKPELSAPVKALARLYEGRIVLVNQNLLVVYDTDNREVGKTLISKEPVKALQGEESLFYNRASALAELTVPILYQSSDKTEEQAIGAMIITASFSDIKEKQELFNDNILMLLIGAAVVLIGAAALIARRMTRPLYRLSEEIEQVTDNYDGTQSFDHQTKKSFQEVNRISDAFQNMMERVSATEKSRQEFVSNVSHELKTPLTAIKVLSDSLILEPDAPIEMYREFNRDINSEIDREAKIVNDLLSLVRLGKASGDLHISEVNINQLAETTMRRLKPLALQRGIEMTIESYRNITAEVDDLKLSLVLTNLIENAIKYNRDGGKVMVSLNADHKFFYIKVEDTGVGIPEEEQSLIFERFYRVDKARSRETGGTGLGLAITKSAVQLHRGSVKVQSVPGVGSIFTIRIPLSFVSTEQR